MRSLRAVLVAAAGLCALAFAASGALAAGPTIPLTTLSQVTTSSATLEADINPQGKATKYHFEYGLADCSSSSCTSTPQATLAKGTSPVRVKAEVKGLSAGTTYHFLVVAENADDDVKSSDRIFMPYLPPQEFGACASDQFRAANPAAARIEYSSANLPDCRAYEQATPVDKGAGDASGTAPFARAALSGGAISFLSVSGVPGGVGSQEFPLYLASRGDNWSTHGLLPPADTGQQAAVIGWTPDFSGVYTKATELGEPQLTTFLATSPGGEPKTIAPYTNELSPNFAGASQGGDEVIFESKVAIPGVAGAIEGKSNVYLWDKAGGALSLADVMNDGQAPPSGAFAGSYDWLNGTSLKTLSEGGAARRYYLQDEHAIAADGSAIYFTAAGSGQLYVRLNPTEVQSDVNGEGKCTKPALACTINLSASDRTIPDPAGTRAAAFMGASTDGSKALFTSSEMLTNNANTGPEQKPATIERTNKNGEGLMPNLVSTHGTAVAVDGEHIYWINPESGSIMRAKLDGTEIENEFIAATANPKDLAIAGGEIYWTNAAEEEGEGTIGRAKLNGEAPASEVDQDFIEGAGNPHGIAVGAGFIFWTNEAPVGVPDPGAIGRASIAGSGVNSELFAIPGLGRTELPGIAVDESHVYWIESNEDDFSRISRSELDGGEYSVTYIFLGQHTDGKDVAVDGTHIYWSTQASETIGRAKLNGEAPASEVEPELIKEANHPQGVAVDASSIYWTANGESSPNPGNDLYLYDNEAEALSDLAPDSTSAAGADVKGVLGFSGDASYVYFAANGVPNGVTGSPNARGEAAEAGDCKGILSVQASGSCNLYLAHGGNVRFIARLDTGGSELETDAANYAGTPRGIFPNSVFQRTARVSPTGKSLLFRSQRQLSSYQNEGVSELYLYHDDAGRLSCVSCNPAGEPPASTDPAGLGRITTAAVFPNPPASTLSHNLSADGTRVFFETTDALVGTDTNGDAGCPRRGTDLQEFPACIDTYEWEAQGTGSCDAVHAVADGGCIYLISTGKGAEPQLIADASGDGSEVFFYTRSRLVGQDEDSLLDVYSARVEGGLAAQNPPLSNPCLSTEACHPNGPQPAEIPSPPKFSGAGNPKQKSQSCPKGKHKVKGRCVAKKHRKKAAKGKAGAKGRSGR